MLQSGNRSQPRRHGCTASLGDTNKLVRGTAAHRVERCRHPHQWGCGYNWRWRWHCNCRCVCRLLSFFDMFHATCTVDMSNPRVRCAGAEHVRVGTGVGTGAVSALQMYATALTTHQIQCHNPCARFSRSHHDYVKQFRERPDEVVCASILCGHVRGAACL